MAYAGKPIVLEGGNIKNKELKIILDYEASLTFFKQHHLIVRKNSSILRWIWVLETLDLMDSTPETHSAHSPGTQEVKVGRLSKHQGQLSLDETLSKTERKKIEIDL